MPSGLPPPAIDRSRCLLQSGTYPSRPRRGGRVLLRLRRPGQRGGQGAHAGGVHRRPRVRAECRAAPHQAVGKVWNGNLPLGVGEQGPRPPRVRVPGSRMATAIQRDSPGSCRGPAWGGRRTGSWGMQLSPARTPHTFSRSPRPRPCAARCPGFLGRCYMRVRTSRPPGATIAATWKSNPPRPTLFSCAPFSSRSEARDRGGSRDTKKESGIPDWRGPGSGWNRPAGPRARGPRGQGWRRRHPDAAQRPLALPRRQAAGAPGGGAGTSSTRPGRASRRPTRWCCWARARTCRSGA